jgi:hypothetical protein
MNSRISDFTLQRISGLTRNVALKNTISSVLSSHKREMLQVTSKNKQLHLECKDGSVSTIGVHLKATHKKLVKLKSYTGKPWHISLNCGSFGYDVFHVTAEKAQYDKHKQDFVNWMQTQKREMLFFSFQDLPYDVSLFTELNKQGFEIIWWPQQFCSEGQYTRQDSGVAVVINRNIELSIGLKIENISVCFHHDVFPDIAYLMNMQSMPYVQVTSTLCVQFAHPQTDYCIASHYQNPFSSVQTRLKNVHLIAHQIANIVHSHATSHAGKQIITRWAGDFNPYGVNTSRKIVFMPVMPFSFILTFVIGMFAGVSLTNFFKNGVLWAKSKNPANQSEIQKLEQIIGQYGLVSIIGYREASKLIQVSSCMPKPLQRLFVGLHVPFDLDFCITTRPDNATIIEDNRPFGTWDHKTLKISL